MVRRKTTLVIGAVLLAMFPIASADSAGCMATQDATALSVGDLYYVKERHDGTIYLVVYAETNGLAGLQTSYTSCGYGKPMIEPDTRIAKFSQTFEG